MSEASTPAANSYDPRAVEPEINQFWEARGDFNADADPLRQPFTIVIPPPNVTGALHLGHALNNTLQDILTRRKRMQGFVTCWLPGTDHAGIATQAVVEKRLKEEQNLSRHDLGRDALVKKIWEWKEDYNARILGQLRRMGCSCDWRRMRFTLDEQCAKAVYETFFRMFRDGLIYRGLRLVNWDASLQTAVADDEIEHKPVKTNLWHIRYPILQCGPKPAPGDTGAGCPPTAAEIEAALSRATAPDAQLGVDYLVVATTRPETMLADTAVAAHPDDERYQHLLYGPPGRQDRSRSADAGSRTSVLLPLMWRPIPVVGDGLLVNKEFGAGCVKVTPGHDPNDHACWQRKLGQPDEFAIIDLLTPDGKINANGRGRGVDWPYRGSASAPRHLSPFDYADMKKEDARKKVVADLESLGLLEKIEPYETDVGHSDRSKTPIEPLRSEQWFVKMEHLAETAMEAVRDGRVRFFPERYAKTYLDWLGEKRDWCISRQLWWGHRIPVWAVLPNAAGAPAEPDQASGAAQLVAYFEAAEVSSREYVIRHEEQGVFRVCAGSPRAMAALSALEEFKTAELVESRPAQPPRARSEVRGYPSATRAALAMDSVLEVCQDPDVLDTWFSSALWPHSTFGWPEPSPAAFSSRKCAAAGPAVGLTTDLDYFYPTSLLSTAREIITLWVARMVITGLYNLQRVPFQHVYIHAVVQDAWGSRMNKSAGNGMDPLDLIDAYGADAMRFSLAQIAGDTQDVRVPGAYRCPHCAGEFPQKPADLKKPIIECRACKQSFATRIADEATIQRLGLGLLLSPRFEVGRNLANKLWQAATGFIFTNIAQGGVGAEDVRPLALASLPLEDRWILSRLAACVDEVDARLDRYQFSDAVNALYSFFWSDFCDWYIELVKPRLWGPAAPAQTPVPTRDRDAAARQTLAFVLDQTLRLLHPVMPFVTEALWKRLNAVAPRRGIDAIYDGDPAIITATWPSGGEPLRCSAPSAEAAPRAEATALAPAGTLASWRNLSVERDMASLQEVIRATRDIRTQVNKLRAAAKEKSLRTLPRAVVRSDAATVERLGRSLAVLKRLGQCDEFTIGVDVAKPDGAAGRVLSGIEIYVPMTGLANLEVELQRLAKERGELEGHLQRVEAKLANEGFVAKAPPAVLEKERERSADLRARIAVIDESLSGLGG